MDMSTTNEIKSKAGQKGKKKSVKLIIIKNKNKKEKEKSRIPIFSI
jgi:hypothetical protein